MLEEVGQAVAAYNQLFRYIADNPDMDGKSCVQLLLILNKIIIPIKALAEYPKIDGEYEEYHLRMLADCKQKLTAILNEVSDA